MKKILFIGFVLVTSVIFSQEIIERKTLKLGLCLVVEAQKDLLMLRF